MASCDLAFASHIPCAFSNSGENFDTGRFWIIEFVYADECALMALLTLIEVLPRERMDICRQCIELQLFSFGLIYEIGFRMKVMWIRIL